MSPDQRVVLPRAAVDVVARDFHDDRCDPTEGHHVACLLPLLQDVDRRLVETYRATSVSGDCLDPVKHGACSGCACTCHTKERPRPTHLTASEAQT